MYTEASTSEHGQSEFAIKGLTAPQLETIYRALKTFLFTISKDSTDEALIDIIDEIWFIDFVTDQLKEQLILEQQLRTTCRALVKFQEPKPLPYNDDHLWNYVAHEFEI